MGSKAAIVVFSEGDPKKVFQFPFPEDNSSRAKALSETVLGCEARELGPLALDLAAWPEEEVVCTGSFGQLDIICSRQFARCRPSLLADEVSRLAAGRNSYTVFMHSGEDWSAFSVWKNGVLMRSLSVNPKDGFIEDVGERLLFESPFWEGGRPLQHNENYALPFHPIDLGNEALREFFGFIIEGREEPSNFDPEDMEMFAFQKCSG